MDAVEHTTTHFSSDKLIDNNANSWMMDFPSLGLTGDFTETSGPVNLSTIEVDSNTGLFKTRTTQGLRQSLHRPLVTSTMESHILEVDSLQVTPRNLPLTLGDLKLDSGNQLRSLLREGLKFNRGHFK